MGDWVAWPNTAVSGALPKRYSRGAAGTKFDEDVWVIIMVLSKARGLSLFLIIRGA
jgi:hypothetical protein